MSDDLVKRLRIKAGVMEMGEKIAWGSDTALMREAAARIEALIAESKLLHDAIYIDDLTVTMQASDRSKAIAAIGRALDLLGADMLGEANTTLRTTLAELKG